MREYQFEYANMWFMEPSSLQQAGGCWIVRAGRNQAKPHYRIGPKRIECYSLHFILEGKLKLKPGEEEEVELEGGDLFCLFPDKTYRYSSVSGDRALQLNWLAINGPQVPQILEALGLKRNKTYLKGVVVPEIRAVLKQLLAQISKSEAYSFMLQSLLFLLLDKLTSTLSFEPAGSSSRHDWVSRSMEYMEQHFTEPLSVEQLAQMAGIQRSYFSTAFKERTGMSPAQYLRHLRMEMGVQLLKTTKLSVTEVALSTGYPELFAFSRAFKRHYGISPSEYRD
ncbi:AraC family transcriptional regulator [Paenibacillus sp. CC-CFT747]|nr:AraC family transcriptional regulator [Paenibacillus sp. CC-CFT747]